MNRKYVKEVYDDHIVNIQDTKYYYKDNFPYKQISKTNNVFYFNKTCKLHNLDGPAIEWASGVKDYYIDGERYSREDWLEKVKEYE